MSCGNEPDCPHCGHPYVEHSGPEQTCVHKGCTTTRTYTGPCFLGGARRDDLTDRIAELETALGAARQETESWQREVLGRDGDIERLRALIVRLDHGGEEECDCPVCHHPFDDHNPGCPVAAVIDSQYTCVDCGFTRPLAAGETWGDAWTTHKYTNFECKKSDQDKGGG